MHILLIIVLAVVIAGTWIVLPKGTQNDEVPVPAQPLEILNAIDSAKEAKDAIEGRGADEGTTLNLSGQKLSSVPKYVFERTNLTNLNLSNNLLSGSLPAEIRLLSKLRSLDLSNNNFTGVPAEIGQLSQLEILDLSGNAITGLPHELANLKNLKSLDLRNTSYSKADLEIIKKGLPASVVISI